MAAELKTIKLNADEHFLLDQPLLRLPTEITRTNLKSVQIAIDQAKKAVVPTLTKTASTALSTSSHPDNVVSTAEAALASIDNMIGKTNTLKRKLSAISASTDGANTSLGARLDHMNQLNQISSLADVKYDEWSRIRLDRLLVDYLLRTGYVRTASQLATAQGIDELVRVEIAAFESCGRIQKALLSKSTKEALAWCGENRKELGKLESDLEFELRLQQYIELIRDGQKLEAVIHAQKHLTSHKDSDLVLQAAGLLAFDPEMNFPASRDFFSDQRWEDLADRFVTTHHQLYNIPSVPQLNTALSAGLSALKTPACHSQNNPHALAVEPRPITNGHTSANGASTSSNRATLHPSSIHALLAPTSPPTNGHIVANPSPPAASSAYSAPICPICSTELNTLALNVPYAHHSKSHVDSDPVVLPNGRIYGSERLHGWNEKLGTRLGKVRDPWDNNEFDETSVRKVFIS